ncbi:acyltransferase family protein [Candidatus Latescibacterota bacterium]
MPDNNSLISSNRLTSLDAFRGLTMILLVSEAFGIPHLRHTPGLGMFARQFTHHPWNGLYFWDLIQPFFMFIVGVAMPFSFMKRWERGESWGSTLLHVMRRSVVLFSLGVILHCAYSGRLVWELWNVLTQLSVTYFIAFLFMRKSIRTQLIVSFAILLGNYLAYRFIPLPGVTDPWAKDSNLGAYMDTILMGKLNNGGGWVTINFIGSTAHTMWGVIAGLVLKSARPDMKKVKLLASAGIAGVVLGILLNPVTPVIKRICTSSFIIVSGGFCLLALAFFYWIVDVKGHKKWTTVLVIAGMNPIFIYLYRELLGGWTNNFIGIFTGPFLEHLGVAGEMIQETLLLAVIWSLAYWLYKHIIIIRI